MTTQTPAVQNGKDIARDLLIRVNGGDRITFPVDTAVIATNLGIKVQAAALSLDTAGLAVRETPTSQTNILLNSINSVEENRVVLARLIARVLPHLDSEGVLGFVEPAYRGDDQEGDFVDEFAAEFIAPASVVRRWWGAGKSTKKIANRFGITRQEMENRLAHLGLY